MKEILLLILGVYFAVNVNSQILRVRTSPAAVQRLPGLADVKEINTLSYRIPFSDSTTPGRIHSTQIPVNITTTNGNITKTLKGLAWTLKISVPNASNLGLIFDKFKLSDEALMYIFNGKQTVMDTAIAQKNFAYSEFVSITPVQGSELIIFIIEQGNFSFFKSDISIRRLIVDGLSITSSTDSSQLTLQTASIDCNPSIQCTQSKMPWARAVGRFNIPYPGAISNCTCTMLNNEAANGRPIALTALHCIDLNNDKYLSTTELSYLSSAYITFRNWQTGCGTNVDELGVRFTGVALRQYSTMSDFAVIELLNPPGIGDGVNYAGWNRQASPPNDDASFVIHHPDGEDMRYTTTRYVRHYAFNSTKYWETAYRNGTVTYGSSGSGLFNENGQVVGQLSKGVSGCDNPDLPDLFGKVDGAWAAGSGNLHDALSPTQNLSAMDLLDLTNIPINGPGTLSCTVPAGFSTLPGLAGVNYTWSVSSGLEIKSGQGTANISVAGVAGYGSGFLTLNLASPNKGLTRTYSVTRRIFVNQGGSGNLSGTYNSPTSRTAPLMSSATTYNNACLAAFTNMIIPAGSTPAWSVNSLSSGVTWTVSGKDIAVYFTAINQTADFTLTTTAGGSCTALGRYRFKCTSNSSCGGVNPIVAPNPATSSVTLVPSHTMQKEGEVRVSELRILDKLGNLKKVKTRLASAQSFEIDVSDLAPGIYIMTYFNGLTWKSEKFVKK